MRYAERTVASATILDLRGRLTFTSGAEMGRSVQALVDGGATRVILNLEHVAYVDSAGLGAMVETFTAARHRAVKLVLMNPTIRTRHLLEITGLNRVVDTFDSELAALASFETLTSVEAASPPASVL